MYINTIIRTDFNEGRDECEATLVESVEKFVNPDQHSNGLTKMLIL
jgi:hypothetical protein